MVPSRPGQSVHFVGSKAHFLLLYGKYPLYSWKIPGILHPELAQVWFPTEPAAGLPFPLEYSAFWLPLPALNRPGVDHHPYFCFLFIPIVLSQCCLTLHSMSDSFHSLESLRPSGIIPCSSWSLNWNFPVDCPVANFILCLRMAAIALDFNNLP